MRTRLAPELGGAMNGTCHAHRQRLARRLLTLLSSRSLVFAITALLPGDVGAGACSARRDARGGRGAARRAGSRSAGLAALLALARAAC